MAGGPGAAAAVRYRSFVLPAAGIAFVLLGALTYGNLNRNLVYYLTPTEALAQQGQPDRRFRLGGQVLEGTVETIQGGVRFEVGDGLATVKVLHQGAPPQLFQEGIGVVVEGSWTAQGNFASDTMIVRHDEEYRAPDTEGRPAPDGEATE